MTIDCTQESSDFPEVKQRVVKANFQGEDVVLHQADN